MTTKSPRERAAQLLLNANSLWSPEDRLALTDRIISTLGARWLPIEHAPKDGTKVDLWVVDKTSIRLTDCWWEEGNWKYIGDPHDMAWTVDELHFGRITHFMYLPAPPADRGGE
jgi:hypothetical protein